MKIGGHKFYIQNMKYYINVQRHVNLELIPKSHSPCLFLKQNILAMEEALNWVKYAGDMTMLSKLGAVDNCWPMLSIFFTECKYNALYCCSTQFLKVLVQKMERVVIYLRI